MRISLQNARNVNMGMHYDYTEYAVAERRIHCCVYTIVAKSKKKLVALKWKYQQNNEIDASLLTTVLVRNSLISSWCRYIPSYFIANFRVNCCDKEKVVAINLRFMQCIQRLSLTCSYYCKNKQSDFTFCGWVRQHTALVCAQHCSGKS